MPIASVPISVPVLAVPRRSRKPQVLLDLRTVAIEIPEADPGAFEPVAFTPAGPLGGDPIGRALSDETGCGLYARGGALWHRLVESGTDRSLEPARFLGFLAETDPGRGTWLTDLLARTPTLAAYDHALGRGRSGMPHLLRGVPGVLDGAHIILDPGGSVEAGARARLERDVAVAGGAVYVRIGAPVAIQSGYVAPPDLRTTLFPGTRAAIGNFCRFDDAERFLDIQDRHGLPVDGLPGVRGRLFGAEGAAGIPPGLLGDEDLRLLACCGAEALYRFLRRPASLADDLAPDHALAALLAHVGLVPGDDVEAALLRLAAGIDAVSARAPHLPDPLGFARDYIRAVALPRLADRAAAGRAADADALAALGPG